MKIGILTYHNTTNYGAIFQTYALQQYINNKNFDCEVIDYTNEVLIDRYDKNPLHSKNIKEFIKRVLFYKNNFVIEKNFKKFLKKYIKISKEKYNENNIQNANNIYDIYMAGSDQIWNLSLSGNDLNYFLNFSEHKEKNNSYAASFGVKNIADNQKEVVKKLINNFDNVSVREEDGIKIVKDMLPEKNVQKTIDPVFLFNKREWLKIKSEGSIDENYILIYQIALTPNLLNFARKLSDKTGYKIYYISSSNRMIKNAKNINTASPEEFINYIDNAKYVVTSSFHGFALSVILEKEFFYDIEDNKDSFCSRLTNLAKILNVENRQICERFDENDFNKIDYSLVNERLEKEVIKSKKFIDNILK